METKPGLQKGKIAAIAVAVLLVGAGAAYLASAVAGSNNRLTSEVNALGAQVTSLEQANSNLGVQLASETATNSSASAATSEAIYSAYSSSVVTVQGYELVSQNSFFGQVTSIASVQGSGFVVGFQNSTYVVTNYHVVNGVTNITATFSDGNSYPASVKGTDPLRDLAVLSVSAPESEFHLLKLQGAPGGVTVGETVYAIGSPFGLSGSMTVGIVSQVGRTITESTRAQVTIPDVIQFSAAINPGNSGGPLLDSDGDVIGITTAAVSDSEGLGFAISAVTLVRELSSLVTTGTYALHPDLGIEASADISYQLAGAAGSNVTYGVLVQSVVAGGAADKAGIHGGTRTVSVEGQTYIVGGDIIVSVNGTKVVDGDSLASYLEEFTAAGQTVQLGIIRSGVQITVSVVLGAA